MSKKSKLTNKQTAEIRISQAIESNSDILDLSNLNLATLPISVASVTSLTTLNLSRNNLSELPESITDLQLLSTIQISENRFKNLPTQLKSFNRLQNIVADHNNLQEIPTWIGTLRELRILNLWDNCIKSISQPICDLKNLEVFHVGANKLRSIPRSISQLSRLRKLYVWGNAIRLLPDWITSLDLLEYLYASDCGLTSLPDTIGNMRSLEMISVFRNRITSLPPSIGNLTKLRILIAFENRLKNIPESLVKLAESEKMEGLYLHQNPDLGIPPEILGPYHTPFRNENPDKDDPFCDQTPESDHTPIRLARYLRQLSNGTPKQLNEAKLLVVGPGGHGKSSLIEYLRDRTFTKGRPSTDGIEVGQWLIPGQHPTGDIRLNVWDFGGQEIQYSTHEFFLTERAVYVLVFQPRDDLTTTQGLYYWLDLIHLVSPSAPVIVVLSKQDEFNNSPVYPNDLSDLKRLHANVIDFIPVSCDMTNPCSEGIERLRSLISTTVCNQLGHIRYKLPSAWIDIKEMLEKGTSNFLTYNDYKKICIEEDIKEDEDQKLLADFLHALGTMLNYSDRLPLEETNILKPGWVTEGVYAVALSPELKAARGIMDEHLIAKLLGDSAHEGKYPPAAQRFILQMMLSFKLCYELPATDSSRRYLVPNALPDEQIELLSPEDQNLLRFEIHFPRILPSSVISRFIVAMHQSPESACRMGTKGVLRGHKFSVTAHPKERRIRIAIAGAGPSRVRVLEIIRQHFSTILREREYGSQEYTFPPTNIKGKAYPLESLLKAERQGKEEIWLDDTGDVNVREWLDGVTIPENRRNLQKAYAKAGTGGEIISMSVEKLYLGDDMSNNNNTNINTGPVAGSIAGASGQSVKQNQSADTTINIRQHASAPQELLNLINELREILALLRLKGADPDDCDNAEYALKQLDKVAEDPDSKDPKAAKGAMAMLRGVSETFKSYADIGESFEKIVKYLGPAIALIGGLSQ